MPLGLSDSEIRRILNWAGGMDGESWIDEDDWPLITKLAAAVGEDPKRVAPYYASERGS